MSESAAVDVPSDCSALLSDAIDPVEAEFGLCVSLSITPTDGLDSNTPESESAVRLLVADPGRCVTET